jgi:OOP family OmpA-OmpF porin
MDIRKLAAATLAALLPLTVHAQPARQPLEGFYIGMGVGLNQREELDFLTHYGFDLSGRQSFRIESDIGWAGILSAGWSFGNGFRAELEGNYRESRVSGGQHQLLGQPWNELIASSGRIRSYGFLANIFYDFYEIPYVTPYIGFGVGYIWNDLNNVVAEDGSGVVFLSV